MFHILNITAYSETLKVLGMDFGVSDGEMFYCNDSLDGEYNVYKALDCKDCIFNDGVDKPCSSKRLEWLSKECPERINLRGKNYISDLANAQYEYNAEWLKEVTLIELDSETKKRALKLKFNGGTEIIAGLSSYDEKDYQALIVGKPYDIKDLK